MRASRRVLPLGLAALALTAAGCGGGSVGKAGGQGVGHVTLTIARNSTEVPDLGEWIKAVGRLSHGTVAVRFREDWRPGDPDYERHTLADVRSGRVDIAEMGARVYDLEGVDAFRPLLAPFAVDSYALEQRVLESPVAADMLRAVARAGVVPLGLLPGAMRRPLGVGRRLVAPGDYPGARIGIRPSRLERETFRALGAIPVAYVPGESLGRLAGLEADVESAGEARTQEHVSSLTANVALWPRVMTLVMNRQAYDRLARSQQRALAGAWRASLGATLAYERQFERDALASFCIRGIPVLTATPAQLEQLRNAVAPVTEQVATDPATRDAAAGILALRRSTPPEQPLTCAGVDPLALAGPAPAGATPEGVWRKSLAFAELRAGGAADTDELNVENTGTFTLSLRHGRFHLDVRGPEPFTDDGRYTVGGDRLVIVSTSGDVFVFRWSRYRDTLTLAQATTSWVPKPLTVKAWRRLGSGA